MWHYCKYFGLIVVYLNSLHLLSADDIFQTDLSDDMEIGLAEGGYRSVKLKCGSNSMQVNLETDEDFTGIIYTRGSFHDKKPPCFLDPGYAPRQKKFTINFDFDKCKTLQKGDIYSNVLILQYDKELIMPGDAAFNLECDFGTPRDVTVNANLNGKPKQVISRISLTNADPSAKKEKKSKRSIESQNDYVEITPDKVKFMSKIEL